MVPLICQLNHSSGRNPVSVLKELRGQTLSMSAAYSAQTSIKPDILPIPIISWLMISNIGDGSFLYAHGCNGKNHLLLLSLTLVGDDYYVISAVGEITSPLLW
jgi:hypothetical protein